MLQQRVGIDVHPLYTYFFLKVGLGPRYTEEMAHRDGVELETMSVSQGMLKLGNKPTGTKERTRNHNLSLELLGCLPLQPQPPHEQPWVTVLSTTGFKAL